MVGAFRSSGSAAGSEYMPLEGFDLASEVMVARGTWHPPGSGKALEAALLAEGWRLAVRLPDRSLVGEETVGTMVISDRIGNIPRRISFADGGLFETADNDAVDALLRKYRRNRAVWIHELRRFHPRLVLLVLMLLVFSGLIYRYAIPAGAIGRFFTFVEDRFGDDDNKTLSTHPGAADSRRATGAE